MEILSLNELKEQNAAEEAALAEVKQVDDEEVIESEPDVYVEETKAADVDTEDVEEDAEEKTEVESWMQAEDTEDSEKQSGFVPNHEAAKRRKQAKALRGELKEAKNENQALLDRIAELENRTQAQQTPTPVEEPRPTLEQFDYDDAAYNKALDDWNDKRLERKLEERLAVTQKVSTQEAVQKAKQERLEQTVNEHYERASKLVETGTVTAEQYQAADKNVRSALNIVSNGQGDVYADTLISTLSGEGSEKVMYHLGVNSAKMGELTHLMQTDPTGLSAAAFLGRLQAQLANPVKRRSSAPKPAADIKGDAKSGKSEEQKMASKYAKSDDLNERITLKRMAKAKGYNVNNW